MLETAWYIFREKNWLILVDSINPLNTWQNGQNFADDICYCKLQETYVLFPWTSI